MRSFTLKTALAASALTVAGVLVAVVDPAVTANAGSGTPTFANYKAPSSLFNSDFAGEPSIGINGNTGALMYQSSSSTYRVTFNDSTTPATATWTDRTPLNSIINIDPILATDWQTGRTWAGGLDGECSIMSYSDNDGQSWIPMANPCAGVVDHESIGAGPAHSFTVPMNLAYQHPVYYCAQTSEDMCAASYDGGLTFNHPVPVLGGCGGLHGHVKVSHDGTAYLPNNSCASGHVGGGITVNNGLTWSSYQISQSTSASRGFDPSVTTTPDDTMYEAWAQGGNYHPMVARSTNHGGSWDRVTDLATTVTPNIVASTFQSMVSGDNGRIAVAFLGTTTGTGVPFDNGYHGIWDLYVSYSYDAGVNWTTVKATTDPVQRGCIWDLGGSNTCRNLLDFMDANVTPDGRVVVGYADGCINTCAGASGTEGQSTSAWATIARQSTGKGLFAAYDTGGTNTAPTACFTHSETTLTTSVNGSCSTDPDGPISTYAWSWGDGSPNGSGATASHTYAADGTYTVSLTVTDSGGLTNTTSQSVSVSASTDPDPSVPNLANGVASNGTSPGTAASWVYYKINVPSGATSLVVDLSSPCAVNCRPDLGLSGKYATKPTGQAIGCTNSSSNTEECVFPAPTAGWWYVGVSVSSSGAAETFTVKATYR